MIKKQRKTIRLKNYDYAQPGWYYITVCAQDRECLFGDIVDEEMKLNDIGKMVDKTINGLKKYKFVDIDMYCVMPNHIHLILIIVGADPCVRPNQGPCACPNHNPNVRPILSFDGSTQGSIDGSTQGSTPTIGEYIKRFKTLTTRIYIQNVKENNWPVFEKRLWQRNYYEHIIRNEKSLEKIRQYINSNPSMWYRDRNNPKIIYES